ncbi:MAG: RNA polymerase sigma factor, partial [Oscillospiraceae bacterium]|nr:RNA polymerase sigma factor [Oscillospiraceae bacterium]
DSRESVNDTYLAAWESMPPHRPSVLSAYLAKLTRRISIDCFRYRTREKRLGSEYAISLSELEDCVSGGNTTEELVNVRLLADSIGIFLRLQSPEARTAFLGRYYFLDSVKEVAAYCGMSESKCKSLLHRTRLALKAHLEKEGFFL